MRNLGSNNQTAKAKINLCLHVTGQRADGYHTLDSLVVFSDFGDQMHFGEADQVTLVIDGPFGAGLAADGDNLVHRAAHLFGVDRGAKITLTKNLPVASGIGGGSADAAATLRGLSDLWGLDLPQDNGLSLGADVPVCLSSTTQRMQGIGERLTAVNSLPALCAVLVNPGVAVATPMIFSKLENKSNAAIGAIPTQGLDFSATIQYLKTLRNDLQKPAIALAPSIATVLDALNAQGAALSRMSGSGATCFGLFETREQAQRAADALATSHSDWWVQPVVLG